MTPSRKIVFIGDSIIANWNLERDFPGQGWINRGIGGQRTLEISARFERDALAVAPHTVFILAGTNDLATGGTPQQVVEHLRAMVRQARRQGARVIVSAVLPVSDYHKDVEARFDRVKERPPQLILATNRALRRMADEEGALFIDSHGALADATGRMPADMAADGLHPNEKGYAILARLVRAATGPAGERAA